MKDEIEKNEKNDFWVQFKKIYLFLFKSYILKMKAEKRHPEM